MAQWAAKGRLDVGDEFVHESIIGSLFVALLIIVICMAYAYSLIRTKKNILRHSYGLVLLGFVFGLAFATILTLIQVPVMYAIFDEAWGFIARLLFGKRAAQAVAAVERPVGGESCIGSPSGLDIVGKPVDDIVFAGLFVLEAVDRVLDPRADRDLRDPDDAGGLARADDPHRPQPEIEPEQPFEREVAFPDAGVGAMDPAIERKHQCDGVLGDGVG